MKVVLLILLLRTLMLVLLFIIAAPVLTVLQRIKLFKWLCGGFTVGHLPELMLLLR